MVVGVLGILYSGAAYVPLDPADPANAPFIQDGRLRRCGPAHPEPHSWRGFPATRGEVCPDRGCASNAGQESHRRFKTRKSLAYVVFTSGSTGKPKGVCVPHRALVNLLSSMQRQPGLGENDGLLAVTNLCFDISALELFLP